MADDSTKVVIEVVLDDGSVAKGFANIQNQGEKAAGGLSKAFSINGFADLNFAIQAASKAIGLFKDAISAGISESINGEKSTVQLATALKSIPGVTNEAVKSFQDFSAELSKKIAIDDDVINSSGALLASLGRLTGEGLEKATVAAADLSAGLGISLEDASSRLAKAAEGNVAAFGKLGFQFTKGASDGQILNETLAQIGSRFGGLAQNLASNTFEGIIKRISVAFGDATQALGDFVTKSPVIREVLKIVAESFERLSKFLGTLAGTKFLDNLILQLVSFSQGVNSYLIKPIEVFYNIGKDIFNLLIASVQNLIAEFGNFGGVIGDILNKFGLDNAITQGLQTIRDSTRLVADEAAANFQGFRNVLETPLADGLGQSLDVLNQRLISVKDNTVNAVDAVSVGSSEIVQKLSAAAQQINSIYQQGIIRTISAAAQSLGASLVRGGDAFSDFKNTVLNIIGDIAIQIGQTLVGVGIGIENLKLALATLSGGAAIAAGLALIAFGGLLKSLGGGVGATGGGVAGGGLAGADISSPSFNGGESPISSANDARTPKTEVVVNVNGDVLGDESSGRKIVELINSAFDTSGVNLREGIV